MKIPRIGVGIIVSHEGHILMGKRKVVYGLGEWQFPGGHLEFNETILECAARELKEETSLEALTLKLGPWTENLISEDKHYITFYVFVSSFSGTPQCVEPDKCEGWEWFTWETLPSPLFPPIRTFLAHKNRDD